jgi:hypothetical protein
MDPTIWKDFSSKLDPNECFYRYIGEKLGRWDKMRFRAALGRYVLGICALFLALGVGVHPSSAEQLDKPPAPSIGVPSEDSNHATGHIIITPESTEYLYDGTSNLDIDSDGNFDVTGVTRAVMTVESIGVDMYLQQRNESRSQWIDYVHIGEFEKVFTDHIKINQILSNVDKGYYYRLRSVHWVKNNGTYESSNSVSTYLYY